MITTTIIRGVTTSNPTFGSKVARITGFAGYYCKSTGKVAITIIAEQMDRADEMLRTDNYRQQVVDDVEVKLSESVNEDWEPIQGFIGEAVDQSGNKEEGKDVSVYVNAVSDDTARFIGLLNESPVIWMCKQCRELFSRLGFQVDYYNTHYSPWKYEKSNPRYKPSRPGNRAVKQIIRRCQVKQVKQESADKKAEAEKPAEAPAVPNEGTRIRLEDINKLLASNRMFVRIVNGELKLFREWSGNRTNGGRLYKHSEDAKPGRYSGKRELNSMDNAFQHAKPSTALSNQPR